MTSKMGGMSLHSSVNTNKSKNNQKDAADDNPGYTFVDPNHHNTDRAVLRRNYKNSEILDNNHLSRLVNQITDRSENNNV